MPRESNDRERTATRRCRECNDRVVIPRVVLYHNLVSSKRGVFQDVARFKDAHVTSLAVLRKERLQPIDSVKRPRCYMLEGAPVVWYQVASFEPIEKLKRIIRTEVPSPKPRLPPRRVADW